MNLFIKTTMICSLLILSLNLTSQKKTNAVKAKEATKETSKDSIPSSLFSALKFRSLGPALTSGRISDLAVNPNDPNHYFVAVASGGVWKTTNSGVTFDPVFDGEGSYSIGCLAMDPKNTNVLWVGTCLLYTSDAADERSSVDLGGRRIIKKKKRVESSACRIIAQR